MQEYGITDLSGASLGSGHLWIGQDAIPGVVELRYDWCPTNGLGTWCVEVESEMARFDAEVAPRSSSFKISDAILHRVSSDLFPSLFGPLASTIEGDIQGEIELLRIGSYECPLQNLQELSGQLEVNRLNAAGASMGDHQIVANNQGESILINISGASLEGNVNLQDGSYEAQGQLTAQPQIEPYVRSLMRSLGSNRYGWEIKGSIPC